jgi:hypothetical protein
VAKTFRDLRRGAAVTLLLGGVIVGTWLEREPLLRSVRKPLLRGVANLWIVSDRVTRADAIVVLGGNSRVRPSVAADIYRRGFADRVLVSKASDEAQVGPRAGRSDAERNRAELLKLGVPGSAIEAFGDASTNTRDEAIALRDWAKCNAVSVLMIPIEIFGARRVRWIFRQEFTDNSVKVIVPSFDPPDYSRTDWWETVHGQMAFRTEVMKYLYYRLNY